MSNQLSMKCLFCGTVSPIDSIYFTNSLDKQQCLSFYAWCVVCDISAYIHWDTEFTSTFPEMKGFCIYDTHLNIKSKGVIPIRNYLDCFIDFTDPDLIQDLLNSKVEDFHNQYSNLGVGEDGKQL